MSKKKFNKVASVKPVEAVVDIEKPAEEQQELLDITHIETESPAVEAVEGSGVVNVSRCTHHVFTSSIPVGKTYTITDSDRKDERGMKKVRNAVAKGYLEWVD